MASIRLEASKPYYATSSLVIGYALCSSLLAVINKFSVAKFNYPGLLTALQYLTSALGVWILGKLGFLAHDTFVLETAKKFFPAAFVFYLAIFTNTNLLRHANVDTFIVFRSLTPLLVAFADTVSRRQPCPSKLTFLSLVIILGAAVGYVATDNGFTLTAYSWALAYLVTITTEMVYIKHMVTNLGLNTWGFVFYNNLLSLMMAPVFWIVTGEYVDVFMAIGRSSARKAISATAFTVTGVVNKFLTVAINVLIWDKHATPIGLVCLLLTLAGGVLYQQSVTGGAGNSSNQQESGLSKQIDQNNSGDGYSDEDEKGISDKISGV
ncbi:GDP-fucose transporter 1-like isoform X2 [Primulina huaijiensis]|uniref:GDP-fucose transporter 1-like isoform X2 n=1 Tax=Primulina huaijiensis TaxID=1492673 RepID=UPI003CC77B3D